MKFGASWKAVAVVAGSLFTKLATFKFGSGGTLTTRVAASTLVKERVVIAKQAIRADTSTSVRCFCKAPPPHRLIRILVPVVPVLST